MACSTYSVELSQPSSGMRISDAGIEKRPMKDGPLDPNRRKCRR